MAVRALAGSRTRSSRRAAAIPLAVVALTLVAPALDLLRLVQSSVDVGRAAELTSGLAALALVGVWLRFPRTSWLAAAACAAVGSVGLRLGGSTSAAPLLSLLAIVALGLGGAFAAPELSPDVA